MLLSVITNMKTTYTLKKIYIIYRVLMYVYTEYNTLKRTQKTVKNFIHFSYFQKKP